jgi:hypothetical protein
MFVDRGYQLNP